MTIEDYISRLDVLTKALEQEMPAIADEIALNALALIKNRIIDSGQGIPGAQYSTKPMLATEGQFIVKSAFKQTKIKNKGKGSHGLWIKFPKASKAVPVMLLPEGYKQFREIQGRPGGYVNGSYTGQMWQGTTIIARVHSGKTWVTIIGGNNQEAQDKLGWLSDHFGPFLTVLDDEKQKLQAVYNARISSLINRYIK